MTAISIYKVKVVMNDNKPYYSAVLIAAPCFHHSMPNAPRGWAFGECITPPLCVSVTKAHRLPFGGISYPYLVRSITPFPKAQHSTKFHKYV